MAPALSKLITDSPKYLTPKNAVIVCSIAAASVSVFKTLSWKKLEARKRGAGYNLPNKDGKKTSEKAMVDGKFFRRLWQLLKVLVPGPFCPETAYMLLVAISLTSRTFCDVWMISNATSMERDIISRDVAGFKHHIFQLMLNMPMISIITQMLKFGLGELKLRFRTRLTHYLQKKYLSGFIYYKMNNLDTRITNPDQLFTQDVDKFCQCVVDLYSNLSKPLLDIFIYVRKLSESIGMQGPFFMFSYLAFSGFLMTRLRKPIGPMTAQEQRLEGEFRYVNSRIITNSEEIAFYQGNAREDLTVKASFSRLVAHLRNVLNFKFSVGVIDNIIGKYMATCVGFTVVSRSFFDKTDVRRMNMSHDELMEDYYNTGRMLIRMAEAMGRLVMSGRELTKLAGYTARVTELTDVLHDLSKGKYVRTMVNAEESQEIGSIHSMLEKRGTVVEQDYIIRFDNVPLITPNGDVLVKDMSFEVKSGANVLVCGPNGCGKSSLFRVLGGLWPLFGGKLTKPGPSKLFYVPQRPYMTIGTLRDQIIYPDRIEDMIRKGFTDKDLEESIAKVHLAYILDREGGWDTTQDWMDVLSGGEKQRIAMARLFYHKPQFAILDECTSAVSVDVEGYMYSHCKEVGITLFTVSHRKSLWQYHEYALYMDGRGAYQFTAISDKTTEFGS